MRTRTLETPMDVISEAIPQSKLSSKVKLIEEDVVEVNKQLSIEVKRYSFPQSWPIEDVGLVYYNPKPKKEEASVELHYCLTGHRYCNNPACQNSGCILSKGHKSHGPTRVMQVVNVSFQPGLLASFDAHQLASIFDQGNPTDENKYIKKFNPGTRAKVTLEQIIHHPYKGVLRNLFVQSKGLELLLYSSDQFSQKRPGPEYACRFLTHKEDREKLMKARRILTEHLDSPVTIKELSRMVAMNECYLKKGFKALFGTTIYNYFQKERMERARYLLYEKELPVSEVAVMMGYSCVSHFSSAFKKHTGIKPCNLLK